MTSSDPNLRVVTCADDPELVKATQTRIGAEWPEFMLHDPVAQGLTDCYERLPEFQFVLVDPVTGEAVSIANSIPLAYEGAIEELPDEGWDWALTTGLEDLDRGRPPRLLCALQIVVFGDNRGRGISRRAVQAMKENGRAHGLASMIAPVRPSRKCDFAEEPIDDYIRRFRDDGLPEDPWLRVHARLGARIVQPCPRAMTITGTVAEWESWADMRFTESGDHIVPGALVPVHIDIENNLGTYIEPNVWMHHPAL